MLIVQIEMSVPEFNTTITNRYRNPYLETNRRMTGKKMSNLKISKVCTVFYTNFGFTRCFVKLRNH